MSRTTANNIELSYDRTGEGEPLVLVHGGWSDRHTWELVIPSLTNSFSVVAYDRRGHGLSQRDAGGTRRDQEDDLGGLIEALELGPANVVGTSFGGSIAIGLATRRPELVRSLVVHEPPLIGLVAEGSEAYSEIAAAQAGIQTVLERIERGDALGAAEQFVDEIVFQPGMWAQLPQPLRDTMVDSAPALVIEQKDEAWAGEDGLESVGCPVLLTQGDDSPTWFRPIVAELAAAIDHAEVHTYAGAEHAPHLTHPEAFVESVESFLAFNRTQKEFA